MAEEVVVEVEECKDHDVTVEEWHVIHAPDGCYRIRPNPENPWHDEPGDTGLVVEFSPDGDRWQEFMFLPPSIIPAVSEILSDYAEVK